METEVTVVPACICSSVIVEDLHTQSFSISTAVLWIQTITEIIKQVHCMSCRTYQTHFSRWPPPPDPHAGWSQSSPASRSLWLPHTGRGGEGLLQRSLLMRGTNHNRGLLSSLFLSAPGVRLARDEISIMKISLHSLPSASVIIFVMWFVQDCPWELRILKVNIPLSICLKGIRPFEMSDCTGTLTENPISAWSLQKSQKYSMMKCQL